MNETISYEKKYKGIRVKTSDGTVFNGKINITVFQRLSDYLKTSDDKFITLFTEEGEGKLKKATIINKEHIIWAETWD